MTQPNRVVRVLGGVPVAVVLSIGLVCLSVFLRVGPGASCSWGSIVAAALVLFAAMVLTGTAVRRRRRRTRDGAAREPQR
jgi:membrane protein YdbS with pleckstrin-like domain